MGRKRKPQATTPSPVQTQVKEGHGVLGGIFLFHFCVPGSHSTERFILLCFWLLSVPFLPEVSLT